MSYKLHSWSVNRHMATTRKPAYAHVSIRGYHTGFLRKSWKSEAYDIPLDADNRKNTRASQFGQQLHFSPVESDPHLVKKAGCHPSQGDESLHGLPIEHLHLFPAQTLFG